MRPFTTVTGLAAPLPTPNIDTDVIMPKQFLKGVDRRGLDRGAFHALRFDAHGRPKADFILNQPGWQGAGFLVVGPNFGCGSSREHAVWGLEQLGIRALIGTSFAGIFHDNCINNGLLVITLGEGEAATLLEIAADPLLNEITVDLETQTIRAPGRAGRSLHLTFAIAPLVRERLLQGLDAVGVTLRWRDEIRAFERAYGAACPWLGLGATP
jgi:3-isopropylmalate/(R)-2-methylmalate dehydratase small subunit